MNVVMSEYMSMVDVLENRSFENKRLQDNTTTMAVYTWKWVDENNNEVKSSGKWFLNYNTCQQIGNENPIANCKLNIESKNVEVPSPNKFISLVYLYILKIEFQKRIKSTCVGCHSNHPSQSEHLFGCLDNINNLIDAHAKYCHLRISTPRLHLACKEMMKHFSMCEYINPFIIDFKHSLTCLQNADPKMYLTSDEIFYHEFEAIDDM